ncbi:MAG: hypothetical protein OIF35_02055, partial [Cellvibrionaceae bacterium]|nr:hypothetical protein [Cellvibrionaceae bacterium]
MSLALMGLFFYLAFNSYWRPINSPKQQPLKITLTAPAPKPKTEARPEAPAAIKQPPKPSKAKVISANKPAEPSPKPELKQVPQAPATRLNLAIPQDLLE